MEESISAGHNIEFFIEGGRTRTGKPGLPKVCFYSNKNKIKRNENWG